MKTQLRKVFWFVLRFFEQGEEPYIYKRLNRIILVVIGFLFISLSSIVYLFTSDTEGYGYLIPLVVFFSVGSVSLIVGLLGSERAVSNIWGNR